MRVDVHVREGAGRIVKVTADEVRYFDDTGVERVVRLEGIGDADGTDVGFRKLDEPPWTVRLRSGDDFVQFVFETDQAAVQLLLKPLQAVGRDTLDAT